ncbi:asparaginase [Limoniibacter endophyticus]|uniref:Asparaginase n=1 Tax=Limoniibacter endophyticus TaxID=1565040 RepID=A0A8J3GGN1_9HYPH|nr:asparaginase [Limoniibacter endophyticus]GHC69658.1 asparaginase [Limoniibacter endophyticus]
MSDPICVEVLRGNTVESVHTGAAAIVDGDGKVVAAIGEIERPVFSRSAIKLFQALPLIETGAADAYRLDEKALALACASHNGEEAHVAVASDTLKRAGLDLHALECGAHWSMSQPVAIEQAKAGIEPTPLHNNCSGKHSGFLCVCQHQKISYKGYIQRDHPLQTMLADVMQNVTDARHDPQEAGIDGCGIPTYAVPLKNTALGFARLASGNGVGASRAAAARRLMQSCMNEPFYVAGTGRACGKLMQAAPGRVFVKMGAEGIYTGAVPELGMGIALKCDDGGVRGAEVMIAALLAKLFRSEPEIAARFDEIAHPLMKNWVGTPIGEMRPAAAIL